jgi:hypothetical protein
MAVKFVAWARGSRRSMPCLCQDHFLSHHGAPHPAELFTPSTINTDTDLVRVYQPTAYVLRLKSPKRTGSATPPFANNRSREAYILETGYP